jgi:uncharacterized protein (TIGR00255 family)
MTISSMTGFARTEGQFGARNWVWELKSVNGRGLDVKTRTPAGFEALELVVRETMAARFKRGSVQVNLTLSRDAASAGPLRIDLAMVQALIEAGKPFIAQGLVQAPTWDGLLQVRGVIGGEEVIEETPEARAAFDAALRVGLIDAADRLAQARAQEGRALEKVLFELIGRIEILTGQARDHAATGPIAALERLRTRLAALGGDIQLDPQRLAQEAALIAARADVAEELERLTAHAAEARSLIASTEAAGRRLDFLGQELTREANTLSAKSADLALTRVALDLKTAVDQLKEQCANVE